MKSQLKKLRLCCGLSFLLLGYGALSQANEQPHEWFVDLGGKTLSTVNGHNGLSGAHIGKNFGDFQAALSIYAQVTSIVPRLVNNYERINYYNYAGLYIEKPINLAPHIDVIVAGSTGLALGQYEQREGDVIGIMDTIYYSVEPQLAFSVQIFSDLFLNIGASYLLAAQTSGLVNDVNLNMYARYQW
ncbi:MAG: hypothetical protein OEZ58_18175 [Gammaproteobacteria bacterium]|nr:hypothetical protein [Gammaproteobacteria bacterium]MDH5730919.1 hypothetical protein [Gammaproteobacteria bacterium]